MVFKRANNFIMAIVLTVLPSASICTNQCTVANKTNKQLWSQRIYVDQIEEQL